jgi:hypothetical protein
MFSSRRTFHKAYQSVRLFHNIRLCALLCPLLSMTDLAKRRGAFDPTQTILGVARLSYFGSEGGGGAGDPQTVRTPAKIIGQ